MVCDPLKGHSAKADIQYMYLLRFPVVEDEGRGS